MSRNLDGNLGYVNACHGQGLRTYRESRGNKYYYLQAFLSFPIQLSQNRRDSSWMDWAVNANCTDRAHIHRVRC